MTVENRPAPQRVLLRREDEDRLNRAALAVQDAVAVLRRIDMRRYAGQPQAKGAVSNVEQALRKAAKQMRDLSALSEETRRLNQ